MVEPIDAYADQFMVTLGPYGASISFLASAPHPGPGAPPPPERVATMRMSLQHLKTMAIVINRQVKRMERESGVVYDVPNQVLGQLAIAREDWDSFWSL